MEQAADTNAVVDNGTPPFNLDETAPIARYFGISEPSDSAIKKMNTIAEFLRGDKKEYSDTDALMDLKSTLFKLGSPPIGTTQLDHMYGYAKIQGQIDQLEREKQQFVR